MTNWIVRSFYFNNIGRDIAADVIEGWMAVDLIKPVNYQLNREDDEGGLYSQCSVQTAVLNRFCYVACGDLLMSFQVGYCSAHFQDSIISARR